MATEDAESTVTGAADKKDESASFLFPFGSQYYLVSGQSPPRRDI